ncbi:MAG TPA: MG2 domain-containing protein, partial [Tepidisphaeraceae bacterium]|nr:MG2 domain-containing protein [Tepidisphaeraceae bacterium]
MLKHDDHVIEYVDDYLHDVLNESDARYVQQHCQTCAICRTALEAAQRRFDLLGSLAPIEPSEELINETKRTFADRGIRQINRQRRGWRAFLYGMAAAIALVASLHLYFANVSASEYDLTVLTAPRMLPGTQASLRAMVSRGGESVPVEGATVDVELRDPKAKQSVQLASFTTDSRGSAQPRFQLPDWKDGEYELRVTAHPGSGTEVISRTVKLQRNWQLMLSSDKPVYQPGQTIHLRTLALRQPDLKPVAGQEATFSIADPKGNVIFKNKSVTSKFGITSADCALADEIIEGAYAIQCTIGDATSKTTVDVKKYVLPKFKIEVSADKAYYAPGARMKISIAANYFFGKPLAGATVEVNAIGDPLFGQKSLTTDEKGNAAAEIPIPTTLVGKPQDNGDARI